MFNPNVPRSRVIETVIQHTVDDMIRERLPGTEGRSRADIEAIVRHVHRETEGLVLSRELTAADAPAYEWRRFVEELTVSDARGMGEGA
jgi:hypothetical protein